jgi:hypothetical protein
MAQTRKNDPHEAGQEAKDAMADMVDTAREVANETTRKVADKAEEMTSRGKEAARKSTEAVADDTKEMMSETRGMAEDGAEVGRKIAGDGAELGLGWLAFWTEQTADGFRTMLQLTTCRSWKQAADIQAGFMRTSIERFGNFTSQHAGRATEMAANDLRLAEQKGRSNVERLSRRAS